MNIISGETFIRAAGLADTDIISAMHGEAFNRGWSESDVESLLAQDSVACLIAERRRRLGRSQPAGFVMIRKAADEAEVLSIAVRPGYRRRGIGRALMEDALRNLYRDRVASVHLEVDAGNEAAVRLYKSQEFQATGNRPDYYRQGRTSPRTALVMSRQVR